jgi:hypothetical protein
VPHRHTRGLTLLSHTAAEHFVARHAATFLFALSFDTQLCGLPPRLALWVCLWTRGRFSTKYSKYSLVYTGLCVVFGLFSKSLISSGTGRYSHRAHYLCAPTCTTNTHSCICMRAASDSALKRHTAGASSVAAVAHTTTLALVSLQVLLAHAFVPGRGVLCVPRCHRALSHAACRLKPSCCRAAGAALAVRRGWPCSSRACYLVVVLQGRSWWFLSSSLSTPALACRSGLSFTSSCPFRRRETPRGKLARVCVLRPLLSTSFIGAAFGPHTPHRVVCCTGRAHFLHPPRGA